METLPKDLFVKVLVMLGSTRDILAAGQVSKQWRDLANEESVWKALACDRFGEEVVKATQRCYAEGFKSMVKDDNRRGALPTRHGLWKCDYKFSRHNYFFCCLVVCIKWDRRSGQILLYLDARGESDLRHPNTSSCHKTFFLVPGRRTAHFNCGRLTYHNLLHRRNKASATPARGHYKGFLSVSDTFFHAPGEFTFCYANPSLDGDYTFCRLMTLTENHRLIDFFDQYSLPEDTPFDHDTTEVELKRWRPHVPPEVLNRQPPEGPVWWV